MSVEQVRQREYRVFEGIGSNDTLSLLAPNEDCLIHVTEFEDPTLRRQLSAANTGSTVALQVSESDADDGGYRAQRPPVGISLTLNPPCRLPDRAGEWESPTATTI